MDKAIMESHEKEFLEVALTLARDDEISAHFSSIDKSWDMLTSQIIDSHKSLLKHIPWYQKDSNLTLLPDHIIRLYIKFSHATVSSHNIANLNEISTYERLLKKYSLFAKIATDLYFSSSTPVSCKLPSLEVSYCLHIYELTRRIAEEFNDSCNAVNIKKNKKLNWYDLEIEKPFLSESLIKSISSDERLKLPVLLSEIWGKRIENLIQRQWVLMDSAESSYNDTISKSKIIKNNLNDLLNLVKDYDEKVMSQEEIVLSEFSELQRLLSDASVDESEEKVTSSECQSNIIKCEKNLKSSLKKLMTIIELKDSETSLHEKDIKANQEQLTAILSQQIHLEESRQRQITRINNLVKFSVIMKKIITKPIIVSNTDDVAISTIENFLTETRTTAWKAFVIASDNYDPNNRGKVADVVVAANNLADFIDVTAQEILKNQSNNSKGFNSFMEIANVFRAVSRCIRNVGLMIEKIDSPVARDMLAKADVAIEKCLVKLNGSVFFDQVLEVVLIARDAKEIGEKLREKAEDSTKKRASVSLSHSHSGVTDVAGANIDVVDTSEDDEMKDEILMEVLSDEVFLVKERNEDMIRKVSTDITALEDERTRLVHEYKILSSERDRLLQPLNEIIQKESKYICEIYTMLTSPSRPSAPFTVSLECYETQRDTAQSLKQLLFSRLMKNTNDIRTLQNNIRSIDDMLITCTGKKAEHEARRLELIQLSRKKLNLDITDELPRPIASASVHSPNTLRDGSSGIVAVSDDGCDAELMKESNDIIHWCKSVSVRPSSIAQYIASLKSNLNISNLSDFQKKLIAESCSGEESVSDLSFIDSYDCMMMMKALGLSPATVLQAMKRFTPMITTTPISPVASTVVPSPSSQQAKIPSGKVTTTFSFSTSNHDSSNGVLKKASSKDIENWFIAANTNNATALLNLLNETEIDIDIKDNDGYTALIWASWHCKIDSVTLLLERGADVNITNKKSETALMKATHYNHIEVVALLVAKGAKVDIPNKAGKTALSMAKEFGYQEILEIFESGNSSPV